MSDPAPVIDMADALQQRIGRLGVQVADPDHQKRVAAYMAAQAKAKAADRAQTVGQRLERLHAPACGQLLDGLSAIDRKHRLVVVVTRMLAWREEQSRRVGSPYGAVLVIGSTPGAGKTLALSDALLRHPRSARYCRAVDAAAATRNGHSETSRMWAALTEPDLLAIDEIGDEQTRPESVTQLARERYDAGRVTLLAGNVTIETWDTRYKDDALRSRLDAQAALGMPGRHFPRHLRDLRIPQQQRLGIDGAEGR